MIGARAPGPTGHAIAWGRMTPFLLLHVVCLSVIWVGVSPVALAVAAMLYVVRMFAITGFYHRYFCHRTFKTSRTGQFLFGVLGASAGQRGPIWWAAHHRRHHRHADEPADSHSPLQHGFLWSHMGWFLSSGNLAADLSYVTDLTKYRELRLLERFDVMVPSLLGSVVFSLGMVLMHHRPELGTTGWQMLI